MSEPETLSGVTITAAPRDAIQAIAAEIDARVETVADVTEQAARDAHVREVAKGGWDATIPPRPTIIEDEGGINMPVKQRTKFPGSDRKVSLQAALEETRAAAARTDDEDVLFQAFRSAARDLKTTEAAFKAAQKTYAEAVGRLSDAVSK